MGIFDYVKGPQYKVELIRLNEEILSIKTQAKREFQVLQEKYDQLEILSSDRGLLDLQAVQKKIHDEQSLLAALKSEVTLTTGELHSARGQLEDVQKKILAAEDAFELESFSLYQPKYQFANSSDYKLRLDAIREVQKNTARGLGAAVDAWNNQEVHLSKSKVKSLRKDALKLALRSFNSESEYCVDKVKFNNVERMVKRIRRSFETCNQLLKNLDVWWTDIVLEEKLQELYLAHEYQVKRQEEKEAARQAKEDQRELEKMEREIREARAKIDKERSHFIGALQKLQFRLTTAADEKERDEIQTRIDEVTSQNNKLDEEEKILNYREQNARAGYVYVISNIGAFGEGVYKIGMTRRLEPMDRVDELGDASVPFRFDVHALVFSDNAPSLEAKLHAHFASGRLNKVNGRKEFFRADLNEIEAVIRANYDSVVEVVHAAPAEQYRESLKL